jgi:peptide/bleomycin uptake transporter
VNSWPVIVELMSIYKRIRAFEAELDGEELPAGGRYYLQREAAGVPPQEQPAT